MDNKKHTLISNTPGVSTADDDDDDDDDVDDEAGEFSSVQPHMKHMKHTKRTQGRIMLATPCYTQHMQQAVCSCRPLPHPPHGDEFS